MRVSKTGTAALARERVAVLGYGSQGRAQALNLRDSGVAVVVGLREGSVSWARAVEDGFAPRPVREAVRGATVVHMLLPDHVQAEVYAKSVEDELDAGTLLLFSHGFSIHYELVVPRPGLDVGMVAPKAPGPAVRAAFLDGRGVPALVAVHANATGHARTRVRALAGALGGAPEALIETTFQEETETDLFGEQAVLCGGVSALVQAGYETLVDAGYSPEVAYYECVQELKLIADLVHARGLAGMRDAVSDTAEYGDYTRGRRIVDDRVRGAMREVLAEVRSGAFAREWMLENARGRPRFAAMARSQAAHPMERVGAALRARLKKNANANPEEGGTVVCAP